MTEVSVETCFANLRVLSLSLKFKQMNAFKNEPLYPTSSCPLIGLFHQANMHSKEQRLEVQD